MTSGRDPIRLDGQVAVVTGAGRGIGQAHAMLLAERGAAVVVNDIAVESDGVARSQGVADEIVAEGGRAVASTHDVGSEATAGELIEQAIGEFGRLDILVHNAGLTRRTLDEQSLNIAKGFAEADLTTVRRHLEVQLMGSYYLGLPAWKHMARQGYGRIALTTSSAIFGSSGDGAYSASKAAVIALARTMALEAQRTGLDIKTNVVCPSAATTSSELHDGNQVRFRGRLFPENVSGALVWMVSPECSVSGECIRAGGSYVGRVFLGLTHGWVSPTDSPIQPEDVRDHLEEITALGGYVLPTDVDSVMDFMATRLAHTIDGPIQ
jgi:NAD(P)-dependent dehydrogenase (short-subunit alcohol dehydrogenase family)